METRIIAIYCLKEYKLEFGQKKGSRPTSILQTEYKNFYILTATCLETGIAEGMIAPNFNTQVMQCLLHEISQQLSTKDHAVIILDQAGYHRAKTLALPENITLLYLPPYSPELNPIEQLWHYLRSLYWSNKYYVD